MPDNNNIPRNNPNSNNRDHSYSHPISNTASPVRENYNNISDSHFNPTNTSNNLNINNNSNNPHQCNHNNPLHPNPHTPNTNISPEVVERLGSSQSNIPPD